MKKIIKFLLSLSAAILIAVLLYGKTTQPAKVFAQVVPSPTIDPCIDICPTPTDTPTPSPTPPPPLVNINNVTVSENAGNATFTLTFNYPYNEFPSSFSYSTSNGSAVNPEDYTQTSGTVTFLPGETTKTVDVPIVDDSVIESNENFTISVSTFSLYQQAYFPPQLITTGTGTIIDNDTPSNPTTGGDGLSDGKSSCPDCTKPPKYTPLTITPAPTYTPTPTPFLGITFLPPTEEVKGDKVEPSVTPVPLPVIESKPNQPTPKQESRSILVRSILAPNEIPLNLKFILGSLVSTALLVLLLVFPSELFNSTVQSNYDEIMGWSLIHRIKSFYENVNHLPAFIVVSGFAVLGAIINSYLSPDFGFNKATISLVVGMLLALAIISVVYDVARSIYMKRRFGHQSKLRAHSIGLATGALLVAISRFANFLPGYCFGIFTALVFKEEPDERKNGEGLAFASVALIVVALIGWFAWVPVKQLASGANPSFWALVIDAAFSTLWVATLTSTVFGLLPMRFMYGEAIKNWNSKIWIIIYFTGVFLFVYTLLNPAVGVYGKSDKVSWVAVLSLFFAFGIFSVGFWGYFRYRHLFLKSR